MVRPSIALSAGRRTERHVNEQQLAAKVWASAKQMRSRIEASEYKDHLLGLTFYKQSCA